MKTKLIYVLLLFMFLIPGTVLAAGQHVVIKIQGMTCNLCSIAVKKSLAGIDGVAKVEISRQDKQGKLTVDESVTDEQLLSAIKKAGPYKGKIIERN
ncbi:MAG: heavy-metal-associated domain-containing protein [Deltaproteobacteria bacterium]|nr:heavy-metal-associated domain-containing protein [Deltaproteobacteria bacterium]